MLTLFEYDPKSKKLSVLHAFPDNFTLQAEHRYWIDLEGNYNVPGELQALEKFLEVHPLTFEDLLEEEHRPKVEEFEEYLFILMRSISMSPTQDHSDPEELTPELNIFLGKNFIVTVHSEVLPSITEMRALVQEEQKLWTRSIVYILYRIMDTFVDRYYPVIHTLENIVDDIEEQAIGHPGKHLVGDIIFRRKQIMFYRRLITAEREMLHHLSHTESVWYEKRHNAYFTDVYDHLSQLDDMTEALREQLDNAFNAFTSWNANKLNEIVKTLTIFASVVLPLTLITGVYGMNFKFMPELEHPLGYPGAIAFMVIVAVVLLSYFKRKKWL